MPCAPESEQSDERNPHYKSQSLLDRLSQGRPCGRGCAKWHLLLGATLLAVGVTNAADLVWIGSTGNWDAEANCSPAQVPTVPDNVFITNNTTYTVTVPNGVDSTVASLTLGGASGAQTLSLGRSILTLNSASVVNPNGQLVLTVSNSTLTGRGSLTVNGTLNWARGTMSGAGVTTIGSSGVLIINDR
jgi:hypothetical protein